MLRAVDFLFDSNFFQSFTSCHRIFVSFQLYLFIKDLIFNILSKGFVIFSAFNATVVSHWNHLSSLFFFFFLLRFYFLSNKENQHSVFCDSNLFYRDESKEEKKFTEGKIWGMQDNKAVGRFGEHCNPPQWGQGSRHGAPENLNFHDFHMSREAISDLFFS